MRTPQRSFVVEYKSGRRRPGKRPGDIWGNTDIKALVNKAEAEAPHLFNAKTPVEAKAENHGGQQSFASSLEVDAISLTQPTPVLAAGDVAQSTGKTSETIPAQKPEEHHQSPPKRRAASPAKVSAKQLDFPIDDLALLEEENRHLKQAFAELLSAQNAQLRQMLSRFEQAAILKPCCLDVLPAVDMDFGAVDIG